MRCFTVLLACDWMLFVPPEVWKGGKLDVDYEQPLSKWEHVGSFDSAEECERSKVFGEKELRSKKDAVSGRRAFAYLLGRCIPSDLAGFSVK